MGDEQAKAGGAGADGAVPSTNAGAQRAKSQVMRTFDGRPETSRGPGAAGLFAGGGLLFEQALEQTRMAIALADPNAPDCPLVFVNQAFETLTGYDRDEVVGRNCRFLQTSRSSTHQLDRLRAAMQREEVVVVEIENRRKDGSLFVNALHVGPIYDENGRLAYFYGSQWDVTELVEKRAELVQRRVLARELEHRLSNLFAVISSIVRLSGRGESDVETALTRANERILALARAHEVTSYDGSQGTSAQLHELVETVVRPYRLNAPGRFVIGGRPIELEANVVTALGLALHELATNAIKYGALGHASGRVAIEWTVAEDELRLVWDEEAEEPLPPRGTDRPAGSGTGMRILEGVLGSEGATVAFHWRERGVKAVISIPLGSPAPETSRADGAAEG